MRSSSDERVRYKRREGNKKNKTKRNEIYGIINDLPASVCDVLRQGRRRPMRHRFNDSDDDGGGGGAKKK